MTMISILVMTRGRRITETLVEGLRLVRHARVHEKAMALRGKVNVSIDHGALLVSRDAVVICIARASELRVQPG